MAAGSQPFAGFRAETAAQPIIRLIALHKEAAKNVAAMSHRDISDKIISFQCYEIS